LLQVHEGFSTLLLRGRKEKNLGGEWGGGGKRNSPPSVTVQFEKDEGGLQRFKKKGTEVLFGSVHRRKPGKKKKKGTDSNKLGKKKGVR